MLELPDFLPKIVLVKLLERANIFLLENVTVSIFFREGTGDAETSMGRHTVGAEPEAWFWERGRVRGTLPRWL